MRGAIKRPVVSGWRRAIDFGMSSPKTIKKYVIVAATIPMAIAWLETEMRGIGTFLSMGLIISTAVAPPMADARTADRVIPT